MFLSKLASKTSHVTALGLIESPCCSEQGRGMIGVNSTIRLHMHAHILDQSGDWERETTVAF